MSIFQNVAVAWALRRAMELGGLAGTLVVFYQSLPESSQAVISRILAGNWQDVPLGAVVTLGIALWGYIWSYRSTVASKVVVDGQQTIPVAADKPALRNTAERVERKPTILDRIFRRR